MKTNSPWSHVRLDGRLFRARGAAFSLIEVTLALGIVTFALVGVIGVLPVAANSSRQSIDRSRAAAVAGTLFASLRSQPFQQVCYLDTDLNRDGSPSSNPHDALNLNTLDSTATPRQCYVTFLDVSAAAGDDFGTQRHLCFTTGQLAGGVNYLVTMRFNNQPDGMLKIVDATTQKPVMPVQANQVELVITPTGRPADQYRFISLIANRTN